MPICCYLRPEFICMVFDNENDNREDCWQAGNMVGTLKLIKLIQQKLLENLIKKYKCQLKVVFGLLRNLHWQEFWNSQQDFLFKREHKHEQERNWKAPKSTLNLWLKKLRRFIKTLGFVVTLPTTSFHAGKTPPWFI